ncbi:MAG: hypothetical protein ACAI43_25930 [Phycisphaerae bacterium]|nr:hypothetical protein [Tepidisphaeraceae bacterium]
MRINQHDRWVDFRDGYRETFVSTGLPAHVWENEERFRRLLSYGEVEGATLSGLSDESFRAMETLVNGWMPDHQDDLAGLMKERVRRFGRYG